MSQTFPLVGYRDLLNRNPIGVGFLLLCYVFCVIVEQSKCKWEAREENKGG